MSTENSPTLLTPRSVGSAFLGIVLSTVLGGGLGMGVEALSSPVEPTTRTTSRVDSEERMRLESLRKDRLAFLNLGYNARSPLIREIDEEIAVVEGQLTTLQIRSRSTGTLVEGAGASSTRSWSRSGWGIGAVVGLFFGVGASSLYSRRKRVDERPLLTRDLVRRRLHIPVLGTLSEEAIREP